MKNNYCKIICKLAVPFYNKVKIHINSLLNNKLCIVYPCPLLTILGGKRFVNFDNFTPPIESRESDCHEAGKCYDSALSKSLPLFSCSTPCHLCKLCFTA